MSAMKKPHPNDVLASLPTEPTKENVLRIGRYLGLIPMGSAEWDIGLSKLRAMQAAIRHLP